MQVIKDNSHLTPQEFVEQLNLAIAQFTKGAEQNDDITVVAIKEKMRAESVEFKFRKKLLDLVEKQGLSVAAGLPPDERVDQGLLPVQKNGG